MKPEEIEKYRLVYEHYDFKGKQQLDIVDWAEFAGELDNIIQDLCDEVERLNDQITKLEEEMPYVE